MCSNSFWFVPKLLFLLFKTPLLCFPYSRLAYLALKESKRPSKWILTFWLHWIWYTEFPLIVEYYLILEAGCNEFQHTTVNHYSLSNFYLGWDWKFLNNVTHRLSLFSAWWFLVRMLPVLEHNWQWIFTQSLQFM